MSRFTSSMPPSYFDGQYAGNADPWQLASSDYERAKYAATLAALQRARYASAVEVGCSIGVLTRMLAERCDAILGLDVVETALEQARARNRDLGHVRFARARVPGDWPIGRFDLIVLSEVVYFLDPGDVARLAARVRDSLILGGTVVLVHWTGLTHYPMSGDEAADAFMAAGNTFLRRVHHSAIDAYRLDVLVNESAEQA